MGAPGGRRLTAASVVLAGVLAATAACGSASDPYPATGVDTLMVPTPSPDPSDFGAVVDHPYLGLDVEVTYGAGGDVTVSRTVAPGPDVAGVPTTAVTLGATTDLLAQDTSGNVWWFGREGEWLAGVDGAEAGLLLTAAPRRGDGYATALVPGREQLDAEVLDVDDTVDAVVDGEAVSYEAVVTVAFRTADGAYQDSYARGIGLVERTDEDGLTELALEQVDP